MLIKFQFVLLVAVIFLVNGAIGLSSHGIDSEGNMKSPCYVTNVEQFRGLSGADYLSGCDFHLTGVVTLVDTNRDLVVLQDATGATALYCRGNEQKLCVGERIAVDGTNCGPFFTTFPAYPCYPSGRDICSSFETPSDWGEYNLTRMRGYLHPKVTGEYRFWIASDDASELWLSTDSSPSNARKIASVPRFNWVGFHEWTKFPAQRSEAIQLKAGEKYYIEALQEQTEAGENLSVAWQTPISSNSVISVIDGAVLSPWTDARLPGDAETGGILREYWTNYSNGDVDGMAGARPYQSALTAQQITIHILGPGQLPEPKSIALNQPLSAESNYRWVVVQGLVRFKTATGNQAIWELANGQSLVEVRIQGWSQENSRQLSGLTNVIAKVEGVCEGIYDQNGIMMPGRIWVSTGNNISLTEAGLKNKSDWTENQPAASTATNMSTVQGYFGTRGVVTFNDRVFDKDYTFIQEDGSVLMVSVDSKSLKSHLNVGQYVDLGGALEADKYLHVLFPFFVTDLGWQSMPVPITPPFGMPVQPSLEGRWSELEGVVHSCNANATLSMVGKEGSVYLWMSRAWCREPARYVDAKLRVRGVLMQTLLDQPLLLIPSQNFVDVEEDAPTDPFGSADYSIGALFSAGTDFALSHRVRIHGQVTYSNAGTFYVQDATGGIRVNGGGQAKAEVGETLEVAAFPMMNGSTRLLTEPLVRQIGLIEKITPKALDFGDTLSAKQAGTLVSARAILLARKDINQNQVLELQDQQHVFTATLAIDQGGLPDIPLGSLVSITGVRQDEIAPSLPSGEKSSRSQFFAPLNVLLRSGQDIAVISGPPWWTWKKAATLVGLLMVIITASLLRVHLLQRRLERQQAQQLAFSQHVLGKLEEERRRIAVNLHDSLGQSLLVIKNHALLAAQTHAEEALDVRKRLNEISSVTSQAIEEVRRITHGLRPYQLDRLGLTQAISATLGQASKKKSISFASRVENIDGLFDKDAEIHVYRIVQEALNNIVKHSNATEATVVIKIKDAVVSLSIRDNGRGFDPHKPSTGPNDLGYGLSGITERVRILHGELIMDSRPGAGTSLAVEIPIKNS